MKINNYIEIDSYKLINSILTMMEIDELIVKLPGEEYKIIE